VEGPAPAPVCLVGGAGNSLFFFSPPLGDMLYEEVWKRAARADGRTVLSSFAAPILSGTSPFSQICGFLSSVMAPRWERGRFIPHPLEVIELALTDP